MYATSAECTAGVGYPRGKSAATCRYNTLVLQASTVGASTLVPLIPGPVHPTHVTDLGRITCCVVTAHAQYSRSCITSLVNRDHNVTPWKLKWFLHHVPNKIPDIRQPAGKNARTSAGIISNVMYEHCVLQHCHSHLVTKTWLNMPFCTRTSLLFVSRGDQVLVMPNIMCHHDVNEYDGYCVHLL